jgi:SRSO17 transposase
MERMEEAVEGMEYQNVQQFISASQWDYEGLNRQIAQEGDGLLGGASDSRLIIDETAFSKKGDKSVGVARQYNGRLGKIDNCQIGVFASLSAGSHATLVGRRLYLPEPWSLDSKRCERAGIPLKERAFKTKAALALELVKEARANGLRFGVICVDSGYGYQGDFLHQLDQLDEQYVAEVHRDQRFYLSYPWSGVQKKNKKQLIEGEQKPDQDEQQPVRMDQWAAGQPEPEWERLKVRHSRQGWIEVNYLAQRVWIWDPVAQEALRRWAIVWQNPDEGSQARLHYALSNAPESADPRRLVSHGIHRFWIERNFEDAKSEAGMGDYQLRGWLAWQHHMSLVELMMLFLLREKLLHAPTTQELPLSCGDILFVLSYLLPQRVRTQEQVYQLLEKRRKKRRDDQRRRQAATARRRPPLCPLETITK